MTTNIETRYTNDGEWLQMYTAPVISGPMDSIEPETDDLTYAVPPEEESQAPIERVIDLSKTTGWRRQSSEMGTFAIAAPTQPAAPDTFPLEDWSITFHGLPRAYHRLNRHIMSSIFGQAGLEIIDYIYETTRSNHESIGDLRALHRSEGSQDFSYVQRSVSALPLLQREIPHNLNEVTREGRRSFISRGRYEGDRYVGKLIIPKEALISPTTNL